ncbi:MAG: glycosyltransferase [Nitrospirae bacterium]|nr:glycosyltransferase [Nitrospirota bacterium]
MEDKKARILFSRTSIPFPHGYYYERALKKSFDVITYGPHFPDEMYSVLNIEETRDIKIEADIPYFTDDITEVMKKLPWTPDLFLWTDNFYWYLMKGLKKLPCPTACFLLDPQYFPDLKTKVAQHFDFVFVSQKNCLSLYQGEGCRRVHWLTHACDPELHGTEPIRKKYDISFVGTLSPGRREMIDLLSSRFNMHYERCFGKRIAEVYSQSKIVFNISNCGEINMRVFEAMASGSMLLTDAAPESSLSELFEDKKHLVFYRNNEELIALADHYLRNDDEREAIAAAGKQEVFAKHTYDHRVATLVATVRSSLGGETVSSLREGSSYNTEGLLSNDTTRNVSSEAQEWMQRGIMCQDKGESESSVSAYLEAVRLEPCYAEAYNNLGKISKDNGDIDKAIFYYQKALQCSPEYAVGYYNLGNAFLMKNEKQKALRCYDKAIQINPLYAEAYYNLSEVFLREGAFEKHMEYLRKAWECLE